MAQPNQSGIRAELKKRLKLSKQALTNRVTRQVEFAGSREFALYLLAFEEGIPLEKYGVDPDTLVTIARLSRERKGHGRSDRDSVRETKVTSPAPNSGDKGMTRPQMFANRTFHPRIVKSSKKAFNGGLGHDAVRRAFQSVNNRVKKLSGWHGKDGTDMMGRVFRPPPEQLLQMSDLSVREEVGEHNGLRHLMQGAMLGIRNTRSHPDEWEPDEDDGAVLELLGFASWLQGCLDRCEAYAQENRTET